MTATLKLGRRKLINKYSEAIKEMYHRGREKEKEIEAKKTLIRFVDMKGRVQSRYTKPLQ